MAQTPSTMLELGTPCPEFRLRDAVSGREVARDELRDSPALLVAFICNHCPFVKHIRHELSRTAREYQERGLAIVAINSNDATRFPGDHPDRMAEEAETLGYAFPYLFDEDQEVAAAFRASCTPEFYLFDSARTLVYRGQFDDSRPSNDVPVTGRDVRAAADAVLEGRPVFSDQRPSVGCNIKWKPGRAPAYAR